MNIETDTGYLNGIQLEMQTLDDHFEKAVVRYEYPYVDGADLEDLGEKARIKRFRCYFFDNAGQATYNDHIELINLLASRDDLELLHPMYGLMKGKAELVDIHHDDRRRTAEVDFTFVQRGITAIEPSLADACDAAVEGQFPASAEQQHNLIVADLGRSGLDLAAPLDGNLSLLAQLKGISATARGYARQIDAAIGNLNTVATGILQPVNSILATVNYATTIPGRLLGTIDRCLERTARLYDGLANFPARFQSSLDFGLSKIQTDLDSFLPADRHGAKQIIVRHVALAAARRLALETAYIYGTDRDARRVQQQQGQASAFDALGRYTQRPAPTVMPMNVIELEATLAASRTRLQAEVTACRSVRTLTAMALELVQAVDQVKQGAERIVTIDVTAPVPLHVLCLRQGLSYTDAERIMALNPSLRSPNFVSGELRIFGGPA